MARSSINGVPEVLAAAERWRVRCLLGEGSIFSEARLWTSSNLATLKKAFLGNLIEDPDRKFYEKLHEQMEKQPPEVIQLAAEMTWLLLLFPSRIDGSKRRQDIQAIWSWSNAQLPASHPELGEFLNKGVGHASVAFNTHRWREFGFFLEWMGEFRSIPEV